MGHLTGSWLQVTDSQPLPQAKEGNERLAQRGGQSRALQPVSAHRGTSRPPRPRGLFTRPRLSVSVLATRLRWAVCLLQHLRGVGVPVALG